MRILSTHYLIKETQSKAGKHATLRPHFEVWRFAGIDTFLTDTTTNCCCSSPPGATMMASSAAFNDSCNDSDSSDGSSDFGVGCFAHPSREDIDSLSRYTHTDESDECDLDLGPPSADPLNHRYSFGLSSRPPTPPPHEIAEKRRKAIAVKRLLWGDTLNQVVNVLEEFPHYWKDFGDHDSKFMNVVKYPNSGIFDKELHDKLIALADLADIRALMTGSRRNFKSRTVVDVEKWEPKMMLAAEGEKFLNQHILKNKKKIDIPAILMEWANRYVPSDSSYPTQVGVIATPVHVSRARRGPRGAAKTKKSKTKKATSPSRRKKTASK